MTALAVAYSGGRDSSALLHASLAAAAPLGVEVVALHVHHGLHPDADDWLAHCAAQCRRWATRGQPVTFDHRRLAGAPRRGDSIEAWARQGRYAALHEMALAHGARLVLLAHHQRDQAETVLLQALRGAGAAGLAGMPRIAERDGIVWARPWLAVDPARIDAYVRHHRLRHVDDSSNTDPRHARNRLRMHVWPALIAAFPDALPALAASAGRAHEARACADALAAIDLARIADVHGLDLAVWATLAPERRCNALRAWLATQASGAATAATVERLMVELAASGAPARWAVGRTELRRYRGRLTCLASASASASDGGSAGIARTTTLAVTRAGRYVIAGWGGSLRVRRAKQGGVPLAALAQVRLVERQGGEQFQSAVNRPPRSLKKQFQSCAVPQWLRRGPLLYDGERLLFVAGLGIDARAQAAPGEPQVTLEWIADPG